MDGATGTLGASTPRRGDGAFDQASRAAVDFLSDHVPMPVWAVSRVAAGRHVHLTVTDNDLGVRVGEGPAWSSSLCRAMWEDGAPRVAPDVAATPSYSGCEVTAELGVGAYAGVPLLSADGTLFGTLWGVHTAPQPHGLAHHAGLMDLLGTLLTASLRADQLAVTLARQLEATRAAADTDPLTGLLNVRAWQAVCAVEEGRHHRLGDEASVVVVDLDDLKAVNDAAGHAAGDELLREAARVLRATIRSGDHLARVGGDEFTVLCPQTSAEDVAVLATRLGAALDAAGVAASLGTGTLDQVSRLQDAQARADRRMYEVKRGKRAAGRPRPPRA
jgi:diguanylate cyclase (GGDEF)-like protein